MGVLLALGRLIREARQQRQSPFLMQTIPREISKLGMLAKGMEYRNEYKWLTRLEMARQIERRQRLYDSIWKMTCIRRSEGGYEKSISESFSPPHEF